MGQIWIRDNYRVPAFLDLETAKTSKLVAYNRAKEGYAVLFRDNERYAISVFPDERYRSMRVPSGAVPLLGGWWKEGEPVDWQPIDRISADEREWMRSMAALFKKD